MYVMVMFELSLKGNQLCVTFADYIGTVWLLDCCLMSCTEIFGFVLSETLCRSSRRRKHDPVMFSRISSALQAAADVVSFTCHV